MIALPMREKIKSLVRLRLMEKQIAIDDIIMARHEETKYEFRGYLYDRERNVETIQK